MRKLLLLPLLFGLASPAIAHIEFNGGCGSHCVAKSGWESNPAVNSNSTNKQIKIINEENSQTSSIDKQVDDSKSIDKQVDDSKINLKEINNYDNRELANYYCERYLGIK